MDNKSIDNFFNSLSKDDLKERWEKYNKYSEGGEGENNGWIKIESEADLPKDAGDYFLFLKEGIYIRMDYWDIHRLNFKENDKTLVSHYQPVIKPLPPKF